VADHLFRQGIAVTIRALRAERRWTQRELCRQTELSPAYLSELESGQKDASADVLERIASAFEFPMDEFLWVVVLAMIHGEVPNVERREAALSLTKHILKTGSESRAEIEQFIEFQQWKQAKTGRSRRRSIRRPTIDETNQQTEPDFTEDA
jgi:transcriptional regulator with XRE-family HTH domain